MVPGLRAVLLDDTCLDGGMEHGHIGNDHGRDFYTVSAVICLLARNLTVLLCSTSTAKSRLSPSMFNLIFASIPILYICSLPALIVLLNMSWNNVINTINSSLHQLDNAAANWSSGTVALSVLQQLAKDFAKTESFFLDLALWGRK